jgi:hypothetical protein
MEEQTQAAADGAADTTTTTEKTSSLYRKVQATLDVLQELEHRAADLRLDAIDVEQKAFLAAEGAVDVRKAKAKTEATKSLRRAEHAEIEAAAVRRKVELMMRIVGGGSRA